MSTSSEELGGILRRMYDGAAAGNKVASIHLFGIKYAGDIEDAGLNAADVIRAASMKASYATEVNKGMKLSRFVVPRPQYAD